VNLTLSGTRKDLAKVNPGNITLKVDLSKIYGPGTHSLRYTPSYPGDVASNAFVEESRYPENIIFVVEERRTKIIPVEIQWVGSTPEGFMTDKENSLLDHEQVTVIGPASVADQIEKAVIQVDLSGQRESISQSYRYTLCDAAGEPVDAGLIATNVEEVRLDVKIQSFKDIAITYELVEGGGARRENALISLSDETIRVSGSEAVLASLGDKLVVGTVDLSDIQDTVLTYPVNLPAGVTNLSGVTSVDVTVKFVGLTTVTIPVREFVTVNVPEGMKVDLNTKHLDIVVRGPMATMLKLKEEDIIVTVDFAGVEPGTMESYPVTVTFDADIKGAGAVGTYQIWATLAPIPDEPDEG
jgi:YbbR domain-containing protein